MTPPKSVPDDLDDMPKLAIPKSRSALNGIDKYPDNQKRMWSSYYASVSFMDEQVGRVLDELDRLGLREKTAIVFTSDHGYHLGEHTFWQKNNLHEEVLRVPLIISVPGSKAGRSKSIVELMDLFPTLSELAGLRIPKTLQGVSLAPILADKSATVKESALSFVSAGISMRSKDWTFTRYADGSEELYDMSKDRGQFTNLVKDSKFGMVLKKQRAALDQRIAAAGIKVKKSK